MRNLSTRQESFNIIMGSIPRNVDFGANQTLSSPSLPHESSSSSLLTTNKIPFIAMIIVLVIGTMSFLCSSRRKEPTPTEGDSEQTPAQALALKIQEMTTEEKMTLYSEAFDTNKHQTILKASAIIVGNSKGGGSETNSTGGTIDTAAEKDSSEGMDDYEDPSIYLALKDVRAKRRSTVLGTSSKKAGLELASGGEDNSNNTNQDGSKKQRRRRTSIIHPRQSATTTKPSLDVLENGLMVDDSKSNDPCCSTSNDEGVVHGNCVICFEEMQAREMVVWSENKSCPHLYHKECMVSYLAHKKQSLKELELDDNPCPTCRRKFVSVCTLAT